MAGDKGGNFERDICRAISLWWTEGERDDVVWRNRTRRKGAAYNAQVQLGDLSADDPIAVPLFEVLSIECKNGYSKRHKITKGAKFKNVPHDVLDLIDGRGDTGNSVILQFWDQTIKEAKLTERFPILIFKRDYHQPVVCTDLNTVMELEKASDVPFGCLHESSRMIRCKFNDYHLYFFSMEDFFTVVKPDDIMVLRDQM